MIAIITIGISASGKTTWAEQHIANHSGWRNINRDDIRAAIMREAGLEPVWRNWKWKWEDKVTARTDAIIQEAADGHYNIIVSDTNLIKSRREAMADRLHELGWVVEYKVIDCSYDEAVKRDNERHNGVGYHIIQKQWQQFLDDTGQRVIQNENMPMAAIVDIDGTVALMEGVRGPFEWDKVDQDAPHAPIVAMVEGLAAAGYYILFTSGRDGSCRDKTMSWIRTTFPSFYELLDWSLFMRTPGDQRKDTIVKEEIFLSQIADFFNIKVVLDDRPSVCRMWRDLGLNVVQVGNPYIEF